MPRPPRFDADELLDRAVELAAAAGPGAVTMAHVARAAGAPSGSVYYRFASRDLLLAELWLRTVGRFQDGCLTAIAAAQAGVADAPAAGAAPAAPGPTSPDPLAGVVATARFIVDWSRAHRGEAHVLLLGAEALGRDGWPAEAQERTRERLTEVDGALRALADGLGLHERADRERVVLAAVDIPYALVRRHLQAGTPIPPAAGDLVEQAVRALL